MKVASSLSHKWAVPVGALALVLAIGAGAWATTGGTGDAGGTSVSSTIQRTTATSAAPATTQEATTGVSDLAALFGLSLTRDTTSDTSAAALAAQQALELQQARQKALLTLVRDSMSAADQKTFDQLWAAEQTKADALEEAEAALQGARQQLQDLVDKYLPAESTTTTDTGGATGTTSGTTGFSVP
jgi:hypothetical protein